MIFCKVYVSKMGDVNHNVKGAGERKKAFISYSHRDSKHLKRLQIHLKGYLHADNDSDPDKTDVLDIWDDTRIPTGANWRDEIMHALISTKVAVLLLSADFMASDFIRKHELPILLAAAQANEIRLISVVIGPCGVLEKHPVSHYQLMNTLSTPLSRMTPAKQEEIWAKVAKEIVDILRI